MTDISDIVGIDDVFMPCIQPHSWRYPVSLLKEIDILRSTLIRVEKLIESAFRCKYYGSQLAAGCSDFEPWNSGFDSPVALNSLQEAFHALDASFIIDCLKPLSASIQQNQKALHIPNNQWIGAVNMDKENIFVTGHSMFHSLHHLTIKKGKQK